MLQDARFEEEDGEGAARGAGASVSGVLFSPSREHLPGKEPSLGARILSLCFSVRLELERLIVGWVSVSGSGHDFAHALK
jgi:hypothetical protein